MTVAYNVATREPWHPRDISDVDYLGTIERLSMTPNIHTSELPRWVMCWDLEREYAQIPMKVLLAKARRLIDRKLLDGCACGCRGDFELTAAGRSMLEAATSPGDDPARTA